MRVGHGGGTPGASTEIALYPASGAELIALSNYDPPAATRMLTVLETTLFAPDPTIACTTALTKPEMHAPMQSAHEIGISPRPLIDDNLQLSTTTAKRPAPTIYNWELSMANLPFVPGGASDVGSLGRARTIDLDQYTGVIQDDVDLINCTITGTARAQHGLERHNFIFCVLRDAIFRDITLEGCRRKVRRRWSACVSEIATERQRGGGTARSLRKRCSVLSGSEQSMLRRNMGRTTPIEAMLTIWPWPRASPAWHGSFVAAGTIASCT